MSVPLTNNCPYLELSQAESSSGTNSTVVLDGWAADNWSQLVDWARGDSGGLCDTGIASGLLATGL